ncbi:MAG: NADPH-dependent assimilatory sulfite reductase hemoprotein subunit, partial [Acidobacteriota bacterium]
MASAKAQEELIKEKSRGLRGSVAEELAQDTEHFEKPTTDLLKFHGIYQQDDRDVRRERLKQKLPKAYYFMVRTKN